MGWVAAVVAGAQGAMSARSAYLQGELDQEMFERDARTAELRAADAERIGAWEAALKRMETSKKVATQRTQAATSGFDITGGNILDLMADTRLYGEVDALQIESNASRDAWALRREAERLRTQGYLAGVAADQSILGSLLGGGAQAASYYNSGNS